jgi:hypothetical protein
MNTKTIREFITPTPAQAFWCFVLSITSILLVYRNVLLQRLVGGQAVSIDQVGETFKSQLATLNQVQGVQTAVIVAFWAVVGLCTFAIYAAIRNSGSTVMDEVTINREYTNSSISVQHYSWVAIRIGAALGLIIALQALWRVGFPYWFSLIEQFMLGTLSIGSFISLFVGMVGLAASFYMLWLLLHTAIIADRI